MTADGQTITAQPTLGPSGDTLSVLGAEESSIYRRLQLMRIAATGILLAIIGSLFDLGAHPFFLALAGVIGVRRGGRAVSSGFTLRALALREIGVALVILIGPKLLFALLRSTGVVQAGDLSSAVVYDKLLVLLCLYLALELATFLYWRVGGFLTVEILAAGILGAALLSGHRNYHLDAPKELSEIAWKLGIESQSFFLALGLLTSLFLGIYLALSTDRPLFSRPGVVRTSGRVRKLLTFLLPGAFLALFIGYARYIDARYGDNLSRASEGVGEGSEEGKSPLGFHSAVGKTKQPAALIRLEGDYAGNPWTPMLYIREGALSSFNGRELVLASKEYDTDTPRVAPGQPFVSLEDQPGEYREPVTHSVFMLAKHKSAIGIDFPRSMRLIKNPDPQRFSVAYQVVSFAPTTKLTEFAGREVGSPKWSEKTRAHYLRAPGSDDPLAALPEVLGVPVLSEHHEDLRYRALSQKLLGGIENPLEKAQALIDYLSQESIYTRKPGHQVTEGGDPVAAYLFADEKRGYCVHFAHAAVYLLRLSGVPARIGTGYLTDLSYAKDGHILLNMGDRHAWPEIYIDGFGWAVADIQPAKAENEQVLPPDEKLLEELMSKLDPVGEFTPPPAVDEADEKNNFEDQLIERLTQPSTIKAVLATLLLLFLLTKLWLRHSYRLATDPGNRARRAYRSYASVMADLGAPRGYGETRTEYLRRGSATNELAVLADESLYSSQVRFDSVRVDDSLQKGFAPFTGAKGIARRALAFVSPLSFFRWGRW